MVQYAGDYKPTFPITFIRKKANNTGESLILDDFIAMDTETSWNHNEENPIGWIYQWCIAIGEDIVIGRKPSEFIETLQKIYRYCELGKQREVVVYCHNLSYDIEYLRHYLTLAFGKPKILAIAPHKYITFEVEGFIFKCSYKLSNRSLEKWGNDLGTKHRKLVGAIDYEAIHTQKEELTKTDWDYQIEDVLTLRECVQKQMASYGDNLATIPLTSTGYVRRECRKHYAKDSKNRKKFVGTALDLTTYEMLKRAFAGGLTHGNRFYAEETVTGDIRHRDFTSHYPSQQRTKNFPIGKFNVYKRNASLKDVAKLTEDYCILLEIVIVNPRVKSRNVTMPIISEAKARQGMLTKCSFDSDNGRILSCKGMFSLVVTELDLKWILKQYDFDKYMIPIVYTAVKGQLPKFMFDTVDEFFYGKSHFKLLEKQETDPDLKLEYAISLMKSKNGLNGIYGMSATALVRDEFELLDDGEWSKKECSAEIAENALSKYYVNRNNFMRYQWGVWTTAYARDELLTLIEIIEKNSGTFLYADTDSAFYITTTETENAIEQWNKEARKNAEEIGAYIDVDGKRVYYRYFDDEHENITHFRFLHAKCYGYIADGEMKITIAGVPAYEDATRKYTREMELGTLDNLAPGFEFTRCGGTRADYVEHKPTVAKVCGCFTEFSSACIIMKTTKTLNNEMTLYDKFIEWEAE